MRNARTKLLTIAGSLAAGGVFFSLAAAATPPLAAAETIADVAVQQGALPADRAAASVPTDVPSPTPTDTTPTSTPTNAPTATPPSSPQASLRVVINPPASAQGRAGAPSSIAPALQPTKPAAAPTRPNPPTSTAVPVATPKPVLPAHLTAPATTAVRQQPRLRTRGS